MNAKLVTVAIKRCARCGQDHDIEFKHFVGDSFEDSDGVVFDWWGLCPTTGDPVFMTNKDEKLVDPTPDDQLPGKDELV